MAMVFFLSGAGKRGAGDKATRAAAGLGWAGGDVFPWCRHGVYKLCTTNKTSLPPIHHRPNLSPSPTGFSFPHPAHLDAADPGTKYRQPRENSVRLCWPGPLGSREYISRSPFLPIGAHSPPRFSNGAEEASPHLQHRADATLRHGGCRNCRSLQRRGGFLSMDFISDGHDLLFLSPPPILSMPTEGPESDPTPLPPPSPSHHHHHNPTLPGQQFALRIIIRGISTPLPQPIPPSPRV